jgi:hypothetical protein
LIGMDYRSEAEQIREDLPDHLSFTPPPVPLVGHISALRRYDGGYLVAAIAQDDQAGRLADGTLTAELLKPTDVQQVHPEDHLAAALERAHENLMRLRLEAALKLIAFIGKQLYDEATLVSMLREELERPPE